MDLSNKKQDLSIDKSDSTDTEKQCSKRIKKTKGRLKIKLELIQNKSRRYTTFCKRKSGLMKKAYELSKLTGAEVMLLVASETGHVYTYATDKLSPIISTDRGRELFASCLSVNIENQDTSKSTLDETETTVAKNEDSENVPNVEKSRKKEFIQQKSFSSDDSEEIENIN